MNFTNPFPPVKTATSSARGEYEGEHLVTGGAHAAWAIRCAGGGKVCSWCIQEGVLMPHGQSAARGEPLVTHGICDRHAAAMELEALTASAERACRKCGCTEARACAGGCSWIEWDLCSRCVAFRQGVNS